MFIRNLNQIIDPRFCCISHLALTFHSFLFHASAVYLFFFIICIKKISNPLARRRTVTCYLPRSDTQCHGAKLEKEVDQGRGVKRRDADRGVVVVWLWWWCGVGWCGVGAGVGLGGGWVVTWQPSAQSSAHPHPHPHRYTHIHTSTLAAVSA